MPEALLLPHNESLTVAFLPVWDREAVLRILVALANTAGGSLYLGLDEHGFPVGVEDADAVRQSITSVANTAVFPPLTGFVSASVLVIDELQILQIRVLRGNGRPYALDPKHPETVFIRHEDATVPATLDEIADLVRTDDPTPFERRPAPRQDLTFEDLAAARRRCDDDLSPQGLPSNFRDASTRRFTNLGYLCSDQCAFGAVLVAFADNEKHRVLRSEHLEGSVFSLLSHSLAFAREAVADTVPQLTLQDALALALTLRDYRRSAPLTMHVTPACVEIHTSGGLPDLDAEEACLGMASTVGNPLLAQLLETLRLTPQGGMGFFQLKAAFPDTPVADLLTLKPRFCTFRLPRIDVRLPAPDAVSAAMVDFIRSRGTASRPELEASTGLSASALVKRLKMLRQRRLIVAIGKGPATRYRVRD